MLDRFRRQFNPHPDPATQVRGAAGRFGYDETNPIPVDAQLGQQLYLRSLRCPCGAGFSFDRIGNVGPGPDDHIVDAFELRCTSGRHDLVLFLDMYHSADSQATPDSLTRAAADVAPEELFASSSTPDANALNEQARMLYGRGDLAAARSHWEQALRLLHETESNPHLRTAILNNLGVACRAAGDLVPAREYADAALAEASRLPDARSEQASALATLGGIDLLAGDSDAALGHYEQALAMDREIDPHGSRVATDLSNIGVVHRRNGNPATALEYYDQALKLDQEFAATSQETANRLNNVALVHAELGNRTLALDYLARALEIDMAFAARSRGTANRLMNIGLVHEADGNWEAARSHLVRAAEVFATAAPGSAEHQACTQALARVDTLRTGSGGGPTCDRCGSPIGMETHQFETLPSGMRVAVHLRCSVASR